MPDPGREHRPGGGARHGGAPGGWAPRRAGMRGAGGRAPASQSILSGRAAGRGDRGPAAARPPPPPLQRGPPGRAALPPPRDAAYLHPGARAAGATAAARGDSAARGRGRADAPARAAEPPPGRCPAHAAGARAGAELEPRRCRRGAALHGDHNSHNAARGGAGGAGPARGGGGARWDPDPHGRLRWSRAGDPRTGSCRPPRWLLPERPLPAAAESGIHSFAGLNSLAPPLPRRLRLSSSRSSARSGSPGLSRLRFLLSVSFTFSPPSFLLPCLPP